MVNYTLLVIFGGCLLGAMQLIVGLAVGLWVRRPDSAADRRGRHDIEQSAAIAKRLRTLANEMSSVVGAHRRELEQTSQSLMFDARSDDSVAELVASVIGNAVLANQNLQAQLNTAEERLQEQAVEIEAHISRSLTDPLTGLPNRRAFNERLEERMGAWTRRREPFSLMLLDVDHFKKLNDQHGHLAGDEVLATLGAALRGAVRREDAVARYGGEEFAILLPNTTLEQAALVARKVREIVAATEVRHGERTIAVTISGGLAMIQPNEQPESLIQRADAALYAAKSAGRNCSFAQHGEASQLADGAPGRSIASRALELVELIKAPDAARMPAEGTAENAIVSVGSHRQRDSISAALAETCQELRRFLEQRGRREDAAAKLPRA